MAVKTKTEESPQLQESSEFEIPPLLTDSLLSDPFSAAPVDFDLDAWVSSIPVAEHS